MARTYRKHVNATGGSNTEYYRSENRKVRRRNRYCLRNLMAHHDIDTVSDLITTYKVIHDECSEPTEGRCIVSPHEKWYYMDPNEKWKGTDEPLPHYWNRMFGGHLKSKHYKH